MFPNWFDKMNKVLYYPTINMETLAITSLSVQFICQLLWFPFIYLFICVFVYLFILYIY